MYTLARAHTHTHTHTHMIYECATILYLYIYTWVCMYTHTHTHTHTWYISVHPFRICIIYVCVYVHTHTYTHTHTCMYVYIYIHIHTRKRRQTARHAQSALRLCTWYMCMKIYCTMFVCMIRVHSIHIRLRLIKATPCNIPLPRFTANPQCVSPYVPETTKTEPFTFPSEGNWFSNGCLYQSYADTVLRFMYMIYYDDVLRLCIWYTCVQSRIPRKRRRQGHGLN